MNNTSGGARFAAPVATWVAALIVTPFAAPFASADAATAGDAPAGDAPSSGVAEAYEPWLNIEGEVVDTYSGSYRVMDGFAVAEGDMLLGQVDEDGKLDTKNSLRGFGESRVLMRWPDGIVPFELDAGLNSIQRERIIAAIDQWTELTRMSFVEFDPAKPDEHPSRLRFLAEGGCASYTGRADQQPQPIYVNNCSVGSIVHELGHAIGLYHEHTRTDRDDYITVDYGAVDTRRVRNFRIPPGNVARFGDYDYGSIMHYGPTFFSTDGSPTIIAPEGKVIGQRERLSAGDIEAVNTMYATDLAITLEIDSLAPGEDDGVGPGLMAVDLQISNRGRLGAHGLVLVATMGDGARWKSISPDSGWDCSTIEAELRCTRWTLAEGVRDAGFLLTVDPGGASSRDLRVELDSRTLDFDPSSNVAGGTVAPSATPLVIADRNARDDEAPALGAAVDRETPAGEADEDEAPKVTTAAVAPATAAPAGGSGGGGAGGLALTLIGLCALRRRA